MTAPVHVQFTYCIYFQDLSAQREDMDHVLMSSHEETTLDYQASNPSFNQCQDTSNWSWETNGCVKWRCKAGWIQSAVAGMSVRVCHCCVTLRCVHGCHCTSIGRGCAIWLLFIKAKLKTKWMVLSCEVVHFWAPFTQKQSVCLVSVNGNVSGERQIGHTCNLLQSSRKMRR